MVTKFSMEADALQNHQKKSESLGDDITGLVKKLFEAAEPLAADFNGAAKAAFNKFQSEANVCAADLQKAFNGLTHSVSVQNTTFVNAAEEGSQTHSATAAGLDFTAAITKNV